MAFRLARTLSLNTKRKPRWRDLDPQLRCFSSGTKQEQHQHQQQQQQQQQLQKNRRITRNLYRELLRWCRTQQNRYPDPILEYLNVPPVCLSAPEDIDGYRLELLYESYTNLTDTQLLDTPNRSNNDDDDDDAVVVEKALRLIPPKAKIGRRQLVVPLHSFSGLRALLRAVFRLNNVVAVEPNDVVAYEALQSYEKKRRTAAFHALKSLNELDLERKLDRPRQTHRDGVLYRLGQVVQHRDERWRGVILQWDKDGSNNFGPMTGTKLSDDFSKLTTLTTKEYSKAGGEYDNVEARVSYTVLLDAGDAVTMGAQLTRTALQSELDPITDPQLCRIRNHWTQQHFVRYDAAQKRFLPNPLQAFLYPHDSLDDDDDDNETNRTEAAVNYDGVCDEIVAGVQEVAARLNTVLFDSALEDGDTTKSFAEAYDLFGATQRNLHEIVKGDVLPSHFRFQSYVSPATVAVFHLKALLDLSQGLMEILEHRRKTSQTTTHQFTVGDIVRHRKYGFRGVVVAWDPTPTMDVSRWDGLQDIENPMAHPFYQVLPDQNDCRDAFGGERPMRYVCQENLELLVDAEDIAGMEVNASELDYHRQDDCQRYTAPTMDRFKHGEDLGDNGALERCMERLEDTINNWQFQSRLDLVKDATLKKLSQSNLLQLLHAVDNVVDAVVVEDLIKEMRKAHPDKQLRFRLEKGFSSLVAGQVNDAIEIFESILEQDPSYAEVWNKLGTVEFMVGKQSKARESTEKALEIDPLNFQASNGLGLILFEKQEFRRAADYFRKSLTLDPWSPVSSKLSMCVDLMAQMVHKDELPF